MNLGGGYEQASTSAAIVATTPIPSFTMSLSRPEDADRQAGAQEQPCEAPPKTHARTITEVAIGFIFTIGMRRDDEPIAAPPSSSYKLSQTQDFLRIVCISPEGAAWLA